MHLRNNNLVMCDSNKIIHLVQTSNYTHGNASLVFLLQHEFGRG